MVNERGPTVLMPTTTALGSTTSTDTKASTKRVWTFSRRLRAGVLRGSSICKKQMRGRNPHVTGKVLNS